MPNTLSNITKIFAVKDCSISALLTDTAAAAPTYGPDIDIPGIKSIEITGDVNNVQLRGDNTKLDSNATLRNINVKVGYALLNLDAMSVMVGGVLTSAATPATPAQQTTWDLLTTQKFGYFRLRAASVSALDGNGDLQVVFGKLRLSDLPIGLGSMNEEDYQTGSFVAQAIPTMFDRRWFRIELNETGKLATNLP